MKIILTVGVSESQKCPSNGIFLIVDLKFHENLDFNTCTFMGSKIDYKMAQLLKSLVIQ